jgi:hypothetical protein
MQTQTLSVGSKLVDGAGGFLVVCMSLWSGPVIC